jgi:predicted kinase
MADYYILIGAPGAGKTTQIKLIQNEIPWSVVISPDTIRDTEEVTTKEAYDRARKRIMALLEQGCTVILDATNAFADKRKNMMEIGRPYAKKIIGVWINTSLEICFERHCKRMECETSNRYPKDTAVYKETIRGYCDALAKDPPAISEGFDELWEIKP